MESQPQNPEFRINPDNFHPCSLRHVCFIYFVLNNHFCIRDLFINNKKALFNVT